MRMTYRTQLTLLAAVCACTSSTLGEDVRKLTSIAHTEYAEERADLYLGGSGVSPVNGHVFQAVLVQSDREESVFDYYLWELDPDGEKINDWLIRAEISNEGPFPARVVPCLRVLPDGNILSVIAETPGNPQVVRFDTSTGIIFAKPLTEHQKVSPLFKSIMPAGDGQAFVLGQIRGKPAIVKVDEQGQILFEKGIDIARWGICVDGVRLSENRFRICGVTKEGDSIRSWVVDVDNHGEMHREYVIDNAPWVSLAGRLRIARLGSNRTAFVYRSGLLGIGQCRTCCRRI